MIPVGIIAQQSSIIAPSTFELNVNGHPAQTAAYNNSSNGVTFPDQVAMLQELGAKWYRFGFVPGPDGVMISSRVDKYFGTGNQDTQGIVTQCQAVGIQILAMVQDRLYNTPATETEPANISPLWSATDQDVYDAGFLMGSGFATNYGSYFTHYELGNEYELFRNLKIRDGNLGTQLDDYIGERYLEVVGKYVQGLDEGIKSIQPTAKTMFNTAGYSSWLLYDYVFERATGVDIAAIHIYDDMLQGAVSTVIGPEYDFTGYLGNRFSRPVWVTETGYRTRESKGEAQNDIDQQAWFDSWISQPQTNCEKMFYHELLDNDSVDKTFDEKHYGLYRFPDYENTGYATAVPKPLATYLINQNQ